MKRLLILLVTVALLAGAAATVHAQRLRDVEGPYVMVFMSDISRGASRKVGERYMTSHSGTTALNQLHAAGYEVVGMASVEGVGVTVILRQK